MADEVLQVIRQLCDEHDALLMIDEVQSGMCRSGKWFSYQHANVSPDVVMLAKALGNGVPVAACLARGKTATLFSPGMHGSTFGGNPLAMAVASTVVQIMQEQEMAKRAAAIGQQLLQRLRQQYEQHPQIAEIRGRGMMIGIELRDSVANVANLPKIALQHGLLINVTARQVLRLLPPLIITEDEIEQLLRRLDNTLKSVFWR